MAVLRSQSADPLTSLASRFDELHELIYRRGGIRPVNAAIDELCKLLLLHVHLERHPDAEVSSTKLAALMDPSYIRSSGEPGLSRLRTAFDEINAHPEYEWRGDGVRGFFVEGDSLKLTDTEVVAEAVSLVRSLPVVSRRIGSAADRLAQEDATGLAFEVFLRGRYQHSGGLGTYLTPEPVVEAMTQMALAHVSDDRLWADDLLIGDPCCGTGRFLISAMRHTEGRLMQSTADRESCARRIEEIRDIAFLGADQSDSSLLKARLNFLMYGALKPRLARVADSITSPLLHDLVGKFDVILTNPPFGGGKYDRPEGLSVMRRDDLGLSAGWTWSRGSFQNRRANERTDPAVLFWDFDLALLRPGGVLAIVLPDGVLGPKYAWLHDALFREIDGRAQKAELLAVVSLPRQTFALSGTAAKTSFVLLRRSTEPQPRHRVFVGRSEHVGYVQRGGQLAVDPAGNDLPQIAGAYIESINGQTPEGSLWDAVSPEQLSRSIEANGNIGIVPKAGATRISDLASVRRSRARRRLPGDRYFLSILHVGTDCLVDWVDALGYSPKTPGKECHPGDVLVSCLNPQIPRITVIPEEAGSGLCSSEFAVLRSSKIDPAKLALVLRSEPMSTYLARAGRGTSSSRRRIDPQQLLEAPVLDETLVGLSEALVRTFQAALLSDRKARLTLAAILDPLLSQQ